VLCVAHSKSAALPTSPRTSVRIFFVNRVSLRAGRFAATRAPVNALVAIPVDNNEPESPHSTWIGKRD
jgi:hypothetical protein